MPDECNLYKNILLVEDDRSHREFVATILEGMCCKVSIAFNGEDAIEVLKKNTVFDVILLDINMPKMDGFEAARIIRDMKRHGDLPEIPVLAISGSQDQKTIDACLEVGMKGLIPKSLWKPKWEPNIKDKILEYLKD